MHNMALFLILEIGLQKMSERMNTNCSQWLAPRLRVVVVSPEEGQKGLSLDCFKIFIGILYHTHKKQKPKNNKNT